MQDPSAHATATVAHQVPPPAKGYIHSQPPSPWKIQETPVSRTNGIVGVKQCYTRAKKMTHATLIAFPWIPRAELGAATESGSLGGRFAPGPPPDTANKANAALRRLD